jgi:hypothetical protein
MVLTTPGHHVLMSPPLTHVPVAICIPCIYIDRLTEMCCSIGEPDFCQVSDDIPSPESELPLSFVFGTRGLDGPAFLTSHPHRSELLRRFSFDGNEGEVSNVVSGRVTKVRLTDRFERKKIIFSEEVVVFGSNGRYQMEFVIPSAIITEGHMPKLVEIGTPLVVFHAEAVGCSRRDFLGWYGQ